MNDDMPDARTTLDVYERYHLPSYLAFSAAVAQAILRLENDRAMLLAACETAINIDWHGFGAPHVYEQLRAAIDRAKESI